MRRPDRVAQTRSPTAARSRARPDCQLELTFVTCAELLTIQVGLFQVVRDDFVEFAHTIAGRQFQPVSEPLV